MGKTVLVVDDGVFMRSLIRGMLENNHYTVVGEAEDGNAAVALYRELKPDLVTMDITMPNKDGLVALKEIMSIDAHASVVMVSALGQEQYVREAILSGAKSFIVKPFDESSLISIVESMHN